MLLLTPVYLFHYILDKSVIMLEHCDIHIDEYKYRIGQKKTDEQI